MKLPGGGWGASLRIGLSMPLVVERAGLPDDALNRSFARDMAAIREALEAVVQGPLSSAPAPPAPRPT